MRSKPILFVALMLLLILTGCEEGTQSSPTSWSEQTFDFSDFQHFEMGIGYTSLFGYNPKPGLEHATIHRTADGKMRFSASYYLPVTRLFRNDANHLTYHILDQNLIYPSRTLSDEERRQVEMTFKQVTVEGWNKSKLANCDPFTFYVYEWDEQEFSDVFCWRNELTAETQQRVLALVESLTQGMPELRLTPMPGNDTWK